MRHPLVEEDLKRIAQADLPWDRLEGKTVLVTGAAGMLPAYMVETLLFLNETRNWKPIRVVGLVRNRERALARFASYQDRKDLELIVQDVSEPLKIIGPVDYVIHGASFASPKYYGKQPVDVILPNVLGTHQLLSLSKEKNVSGFLFMSTSEVYGRVDEAHVPTAEDFYGYLDPMDVRSCYAESKRIGETLCVSWMKQYQVPVKIVRPFHTYGPGLKLDDGRVFADFAANVVQGKNIVMTSDGSARRAFCYIADAIACFFMVLLKGEAGQAYNVGNPGGETSVMELAQTLVGLFPKKNLKVVKLVPEQSGEYLKSKVQRNAPDIAKARALGWEPKISVAEGFKRTLQVLLDENKK